MMTFDNAYFRKAVGIRYSNLFVIILSGISSIASNLSLTSVLKKSADIFGR